MHVRLGKTVINQEHCALIALGADHATGRLHDLLQARIQIGVVIPCSEQRGHALFDLFIDRVELAQPQGGDKRANQACARQVDAFSKCAAQHRKTDALPGQGETVEKPLTRCFIHAPGLLPLGDVRVAFSQQRGHLLQVVKTAEERQVVARPLFKLLGHQLDNRRQ